MSALSLMQSRQLPFAAEHPSPGAAQTISTSNPPAVSSQSSVARDSAPRSKDDGPPVAGKLSRPSLSEAYGRLPLSFEPNQGQTDPRVKFLSRGSGYTLFLTDEGAVLALSKQKALATKQKEHGYKSSVDGPQLQKANATDHGKPTTDVLGFTLLGANRTAKVVGLNELPGKSNYFIGNEPKKWRTNLPNYAKVKYEGVYPGVDLIYYGNQRQLEYDFVVAPGADLDAVALQVEAGNWKPETGRPKLEIATDGDLVIQTGGGEVRFHKPIAFQPGESSPGLGYPEFRTQNSELVDVHYVLAADNRVTFAVHGYDRSKPLVIDPVLAYSTYLGGSGIDTGKGIAIAPDGTAFVAGGTDSTDFPTAHPLQPNVGGPLDFPQDAFVSKLSADGTTLLYSTYLGGSSTDYANAIAVDTFGNAYLTGYTTSPNFPVTALAFSTLCGADGKCGATWNPQGLIVSNAFVTKLNVEGSALIYSGYLGYYEDVQGLGIAVDGNQNVYVVGQTTANFVPTVPIVPPAVPPPPFPIVCGARPAFGGGASDGFLTVVSATGTSILYSTYLGGNNEDAANGVAIDSVGDAFVTGLTYSTNFPITAARLQGVNGGNGDAFLAMVNTHLCGFGSLVYSTYLGGSGLDQGNGVAVDSLGNAYVTGATASTKATLGFTPPAGAYQADCALDTQGVCEGDAFVAKLNPGTNTLLYFTYLGGSLADAGTGIGVDPKGDAYVTGSTSSVNFPTTGSVFQLNYGGGNADAFVTELNPSGSALLYSTFLGGSNTDTGNGIAVDTSGNAFVTGQTCSVDFPVANPFQAYQGGNCDAFISKVIAQSGPLIAINPSPIAFGPIPVGTPTPPTIQVTLVNTGTSPAVITNLIVSGDYTLPSAGDTCMGATLQPPGPAPAGTISSCTVNVTFIPTAPGARLGTLSVSVQGLGTPFTANITGTGTAPTVSLSTTSISFANCLVNTSCTATITGTDAVTLTNTSTSSQLQIAGINASGDFVWSPAQSNGCTNVLAAGSSCSVNVTFTPTATGIRTGALTITDNAANSPQVVSLTGNGTAPAVSFSVLSLTFSQSGGTNTLTLTNIGDGNLVITSVGVSANFVETNTCGGTVNPGASCTITVTFQPTTSGSSTGTLTISDNAPGSPQQVTLSGTGSATSSGDFSLASSPAAATIYAGQTATYALKVTSIGSFSSPVTLACSGAPAQASCQVTPGTVTPSGATAAIATVSVTTTARVSAWPRSGPRMNLPPLRVLGAAPLGMWLFVLAMLVSMLLARQRRRSLLILTAALCSVLLWGACAGGTQTGAPSGTPAGTYTLTVTATSGTLIHKATVTLTVN